jgi:rifampicin phosphotransferase
VPAGFCVTTHAFQQIMARAPSTSSIDDQLDRLSRLTPDKHEAIRALSLEARRTLEGITVPDDVAAAITGALARLGEHAAFAVRSSATAEDLPTASFAGQQDTYLNVVGPAAILQHVRRCWASLFTERAVTYRLRNGFDHRKIHMAVVVQRMAFPQAAGILFTGRSGDWQRKDRVRGCQLWPRRGFGRWLGEPGCLQGSRRRDRRQVGRDQAACHPSLIVRRDAGAADRAGAAAAASAHGRASR